MAGRGITWESMKIRGMPVRGPIWRARRSCRMFPCRRIPQPCRLRFILRMFPVLPPFHRNIAESFSRPFTVRGIARDAPAGVTQVAARIASEPGRYAAWYASKPFLLFDWDVRIGHGTVYTVRAKDTPLDGPLLGLVVIQWFLNPLLFALAFCGLVLGVVRGGTERAVAVTVVVLTAIHVVLQAEPRYAIPYRSLELLLAVSALSYLVAQIKGSRIALLEPATTPCPT